MKPMVQFSNKGWEQASLLQIMVLKSCSLDERQNKFLSFLEFNESFDIKPSFLAFYGVMSSIQTLKNTVKGQLASKENGDNFINVFLSATKIKHNSLSEMYQL